MLDAEHPAGLLVKLGPEIGATPEAWERGATHVATSPIQAGCTILTIGATVKAPMIDSFWQSQVRRRSRLTRCPAGKVKEDGSMPKGTTGAGEVPTGATELRGALRRIEVVLGAWRDWDMARIAGLLNDRDPRCW